MLENDVFNPLLIDENTVKTELNIDNSNYESLSIEKIDDDFHITIVGKNKWDKLTASGTKTEVIVVETTEVALVESANKPVLAEGMTPIKWDIATSTWVNTTEFDTDWYNYTTTDKKWANAKTADGSFWVWIPRYVYKIPEANWHTSTAGTIDVQFSNGVNDNWNKNNVGEIDLRERAEASNAGTNGNKYTNHPAFTFGSTELTGIWVGKFEASGTTTAVNFVPNVASLRSLIIGDMFTASRNMETTAMYGWETTGANIDTHMMKNSEWGVVAYLSKSAYGKNEEIWINNSNTYITGCAGDSVSDVASTIGCEYTYNTVNGLQASTTGNIYGIYSMSGGSLEYTSAYLNNGHNYLISYGSIILDADSKYKDVYDKATTDRNVNNYLLTISKKGEAIYETSSLGEGGTSWNADFSEMPYTSYPWFRRGGSYNYTSYDGVFAFQNHTGNKYNSIGFRAVLLVGVGL